MTKIKTCPFCGTLPKLEQYELNNKTYYYYSCSNDNCLGVTTDGWVTKASATRQWNTRNGEL